MKNAQPIINRFKTKITVRRFLGGTFLDGNWNDSSFTEFELDASVQMANPDELVTAPELARARETIKIYCGTDLQTLDDENGIRADIVNFNGKWYEIQRADRYTMNTMNHVRAFAARLPNQTTGHSTLPIGDVVQLPLIEGFETWPV